MRAKSLSHGSRGVWETTLCCSKRRAAGRTLGEHKAKPWQVKQIVLVLRAYHFTLPLGFCFLLLESASRGEGAQCCRFANQKSSDTEDNLGIFAVEFKEKKAPELPFFATAQNVYNPRQTTFIKTNCDRMTSNCLRLRVALGICFIEGLRQSIVSRREADA